MYDQQELMTIKIAFREVLREIFSELLQEDHDSICSICSECNYQGGMHSATCKQPQLNATITAGVKRALREIITTILLTHASTPLIKRSVCPNCEGTGKSKSGINICPCQVCRKDEYDIWFKMYSGRIGYTFNEEEWQKTYNMLSGQF